VIKSEAASLAAGLQGVWHVMGEQGTGLGQRCDLHPARLVHAGEILGWKYRAHSICSLGVEVWLPWGLLICGLAAWTLRRTKSALGT
jgi:hypothetical protein